MNLGEQLLTALSYFGVPVLGAAVFAGGLGVPLPNTLLLIACGSFIAAGGMNLWVVVISAALGSIAGDLAGYAIGRWAGHAALRRLSPKMQQRFKQAEESIRKWDAWGIFLTRWLITPAGPFINFLSGASEYSFGRFLALVIAGETLWVTLYVSIGRVIEGEVVAAGTIAGDVTWVLLAVTVVIVLAWRIVRSRRAVESAVEGGSGA